MEDEGLVKETRGERCLVEIRARGACLHCANRRVCGIGSAQSVTLEALNQAGARIGQRVLVEINPAFTLTAAAVVFIVPIAGLVAGYLVGDWLFNGSWPVGLVTLAGLAGGFLLIFLLNKVLAGRKGAKAVVTSVIGG